MTLLQRDAPFPHWEFTAAGGDQLRVVPERGGLVCGWRCGGVERLYFDAERFADPAKSVRGGIPILFPVCGNLPGNRLVLPQGTFPLAQHGFARDRPWRLAPLADGLGVRLELVDDASTRAAFPFAFALSLELRLEPRALAIRAVVEHRLPTAGSAGVAPAEPAPAMPFALGLHPYFAVADLAAARLTGLPPRCFDHLQAAEADTAAQLQRLPEGVDLRVETPAGGPALQLHTGQADGSAIALEAQAPYGHAVVWTDPPRPMVCLEPWSAPRGELGLRLAPGQRQELACRYGVVGG